MQSKSYMGADAVMMGSVFAGTEESPEKNLNLKIKFIKVLEVWVQLSYDGWIICRYFQKNYRDRTKYILQKVLKEK